MAGQDPFLFSGRWKLLAAPLALGAAALLIVLMGVVEPLGLRASRDDLHAAIIADSYRIEHAVKAYLADNGRLPSAAFDLSEGHDGGLVQRASAPLAHHDTWNGPYLSPPPSRPLERCFWSLAEPQHLQDDDGDGQADEAWSRLHRGYGELDDETAAWLDRTLDDGQPDAGGVRVTPTWIWFKITEE
jgi:hypothetical protein